MASELSYLRQFGKFRLDVEKRVLWAEGEPVKLPLKEIEILCILTENGREVVTKDELLERVWGESFVEEGNLSQHVYRLRRMFQVYGEPADLIQTIPRRGYRFTGDISVIENERLVIEKRIRTHTVIEQMDSSDPATSTAERASLTFTRAIAITISVFFITALALAVYRYGVSPASTQTEGIHSIAVIPFTDELSDPGDASFGRGMADVITTRLSSVEGLSVRPTSSVLLASANETENLSIARKLQVDALLEGTIYRDGDLVRINVRLVRPQDDTVVWSRQFERLKANSFYLQNEISLDLARALVKDLSAAESASLTKAYTRNVDAMSLYQQGRSEWNKRNDAGLKESERLFREAIALDDSFALAYVGVADANLFGTDFSIAERALGKALELDQDLGEAYASRGFLNTMHRWRWSEAEADFQKAITLSPGYGTARQWYATFLVTQRRFEEAKTQMEAALRIDPTSSNFYTDLGFANYYAGEYDEAEANCSRAVELSPNLQFAHACLYNVYLQRRDTEKAVKEYARLNTLLGDNGEDSVELDRVFQSTYDHHLKLIMNGGEDAFWEEIISAANNTADRNSNKFIGRARAQLALGRIDDAIRSLEQAVNERAFLAPFIYPDPVWEPLRSKPAFKKIVQKLGVG